MFQVADNVSLDDLGGDVGDEGLLLDLDQNCQEMRCNKLKQGQFTL